MLGNQVRQVFAARLRQMLIVHLLHNLLQRGQVHLFVDADAGRIKRQPRGGVDEVVADDLDLVPVHVHAHHVDARVLDALRLVGLDGLSRLRQHLARRGIDHVARGAKPRDAGGQRQLFVELIAPDAHQVVALRVEKQRTQQRTGGVHRRGLAGRTGL